MKYAGLLEYPGQSFHHFFKTTKEADEWLAGLLAEHGTNNARATILEVLWTISS